jgi:hypothetical protein
MIHPSRRFGAPPCLYWRESVKGIKTVSDVSDPKIRLYRRNSAGKIEDAQQDLDIKFFAGQIPMAGDLILDPGAAEGVNRQDRKNRRVWIVVQRVFNPRDNSDYIALVVEERMPSENEDAIV